MGSSRPTATQQFGQASGYDQAPGYGQQYGQGLAPYTAVYDSSPRPSVTMTQAVKLWLKNWKNFSGRASRSEYWWVFLALSIVEIVVMVVVMIVAFVVFAATDSGAGSAPMMLFIALYGILGLLGLAVIVPWLSLSARRLHDTNQSGWMYLVGLIPYAGPIIQIVLMAQASNPAGARFDDAAQPLAGPENL
jgi:uncharacterized membrane protein YhaH (DUF805 family)